MRDISGSDSASSSNLTELALPIQLGAAIASARQPPLVISVDGLGNRYLAQADE